MPCVLAAAAQEEDAALPAVHTNRDDSQLFVEHPRPGLAGELLGDCKLTGTVNGENKWTVRGACPGAAGGC